MWGGELAAKRNLGVCQTKVFEQSERGGKKDGTKFEEERENLIRATKKRYREKDFRENDLFVRERRLAG